MIATRMSAKKVQVPAIRGGGVAYLNGADKSEEFLLLRGTGPAICAARVSPRRNHKYMRNFE